MDDRMESLERRLERLAREVWWYRTAGAVLALMVTAGAVMGGAGAAAPAPPAELKARRFVLVGDDGAPLAALEATPGGGTRLALSGRGAAARAVLGLAADGAPALSLHGADGERRALVEVAGETGTVTALGPARTRVALVADDTAPRVAVSDASGTDRAWLAVRRGSPALQFLAASGVPRTGLATFNDEGGLAVISEADGKTPGLVLYDKGRSVVWSAP
jgi:hypothetical protein